MSSLLEKIEKSNSKGKLNKILAAYKRSATGRRSDYSDTKEETYYPERNKEGKASCIIRFLPGLDSEDNPYYVERLQHGFQGDNGKWYIEFCPKTIDAKCPGCDYTRNLVAEHGGWNSCPKDVKDLVRKMSNRKGYDSGYYCNILVIKDPANPENEGKVHLFKFGKAILDMINDRAIEQDDGLGNITEGIDVFDLVEGANFKFIIYSKKGRASYEKSEFLEPSECPEFDLDSQKELLPLIKEDLFKDYSTLQKRFNEVMGIKTSKRNKNAIEAQNEPFEESNKPESPTKEEPTEKPDIDFSGSDDDGDDENMEYFRKLADEVGV